MALPGTTTALPTCFTPSRSVPCVEAALERSALHIDTRLDAQLHNRPSPVLCAHISMLAVPTIHYILADAWQRSIMLGRHQEIAQFCGASRRTPSRDQNFGTSQADQRQELPAVCGAMDTAFLRCGDPAF